MFSYFSSNTNMPAGIYIGENSIDLACYGKSIDKPLLENYVRIDSSPNSKTIKQLRRDYKLKSFHCFASLKTEDYRFVMTNAPKVPQSEMISALRWQLNEMIDLPMSESTIEVIDIPGIRSNNGEKSIYVVAAENNAIKNLVDSLCSEHINLKTIDIPELALRNLACLTPESENGVCLIWMKENSGIFIICKNGYLILTRRIDFGYKEIFSDNTIGANNFIEELQRSLTFVESHFFNTQVDRLYLCPPPNFNEVRFGELNLALEKDLDIYLLEQYIDCKLDSFSLSSDAYLAIGAGIRGLSLDESPTTN